MTRVFDHSASRKFMEQLRAENERRGWLTDVLADPELLIAFRGKYLNVYWRGQSIFRVGSSSKGLTVTTHQKYLVDPGLASQVPLGVDGRFHVEELTRRGFTQRYENAGTLERLKKAAGLYAGEEKTGCHEIAVRNNNVIDVEIAFPGKVLGGDDVPEKTAPRVDFASIEPDGDEARLIFWEAKAFGNGELRTAGSEAPPVCRQIKTYENYLSRDRRAVEDSYTRVAGNLMALKEIGWKRELSPLLHAVASGKRRLTLGKEPRVGLVIFGYDAAQGRDKRWKDHLSRLCDNVPGLVVRAAGSPKNIRL